MSIDIDTARKVAKLARIRVEEADLPALAGELSGILTFMEQLNEVDVTGHRADDQRHADAAEAAGRCGDGWQHPGADPGECAGCARRVLCGAEGGGMSGREQPDDRRGARRAAQGRDYGGRSDHGLPDRDGCGRRAERLCAQDARDCAGAGAGGGCAAGGGRCAGAVRDSAGDQGSVLHQGRAVAGRIEHPARVPAGIRIRPSRASCSVRAR